MHDAAVNLVDRLPCRNFAPSATRMGLGARSRNVIGLCSCGLTQVVWPRMVPHPDVACLLYFILVRPLARRPRIEYQHSIGALPRGASAWQAWRAAARHVRLFADTLLDKGARLDRRLKSPCYA